MPHLEFPKKLFNTLNDLERRWSASCSDIRQWMMSGDLIGAVWLPIISVVETDPADDADADSQRLEHWEGYVRLSGPECRRLFRHGWIFLREFRSLDGQRSFRLPETSDDVTVNLDDVVILETERRRFEDRFPAIRKLNTAGSAVTGDNRVFGHVSDPTYRIVRLNGCDYRFGETQARVLRLLADAAGRGEPWQSGKHLLHLAGSQSFSLSNLFKRHPIWRELVISNQRGLYRLEDQFLYQIVRNSDADSERKKPVRPVFNGP